MGCARCEKGGTLIKVERVWFKELPESRVTAYELCVACYGLWIGDQEQTLAEIYAKQDEVNAWRQRQERLSEERKARIEDEKVRNADLAKSLERPVRRLRASTDYQALRKAALRGVRK